MFTRWAPVLGALGMALSAGTAAAQPAPAPDPPAVLAGFQEGFFLRDAHRNTSRDSNVAMKAQ